VTKETNIQILTKTSTNYQKLTEICTYRIWYTVLTCTEGH